MAKLDLSLTDHELEAYLFQGRTIRVATVGPDGLPHVVPLWFVWHDGTLFLNSTRGNPTVENMMRDRRAAGVVDDGDTYDTLRGVVIAGRVEIAEDDPRLAQAERLWSDKYLGGNEPPYRRWRNRVWLRLVPERTASWDFRKIPEARARRDAERRAGGA
ncbi:MAG TPA: pyridoxamine 5'-phosphate oxidase family protein [Actinomycetota bacterium]|nr:pyridoxamine 5'-phosphate oxidase family protein [Actinomycetota bacterium]